MATLANQTISSTYDGLIKTSTDQPVPISGVQLLEDGVGNSLALSVGRANQGVTVTGTLTATSITGVLADGVTATTQTLGDNSTKVATTAYVDAQVTASDLDFAGDSGTGAVDLDSQTFTIAGTANEIETVASGQTVTIGLPNDVNVSGNLAVDTNTLYVDAANNRVGVGTSSPAVNLHINDANGGILRLQRDDTAVAGNDSLGALEFYSNDATDAGVKAKIDTISLDSTPDGILRFHTYNEVAASLSERMRIDSAGNVGIGTSSPETELDILGTLTVQSSAANIILKDTGASDNEDWRIVASGGPLQIQSRTDAGVNTSRVLFDNNGDVSFYEDTGTSVKLFWDASAESLGIGTSSPAGKLSVLLGETNLSSASAAATTGYPLSIRFTGTASDNNLIRHEASANPTGYYTLMGTRYDNNKSFVINNKGSEIITYSDITSNGLGLSGGAGNLIRFDTNGSERMRITSAGNVGIGNSIPSSFLSNGNQLVIGSGASSQGITIYSDAAGTGNLFFADGTAGDTAYRGFLRYNHADDAMIMYTAGANERMRISSTGNVGIGTSSPSSILHTQGTGGAASSHIIETTTTTAYVGLKIKQNGDFWIAKDTSTGGAFNTSAYANVLWGSGAYPMVFSTNSVERMRIDSSGNVGIGTSSPATNLEVVGLSTFTRSGKSVLVNPNFGSANLYAQIDSDTGMGLAFATDGGTERMRIDSAGNVGINAVAENSSGTWRNYQFGSLSMASRSSSTVADGMFGTNFKFTTANAEQRVAPYPTSRVFFDSDVIKFQNAGADSAGSNITWSERMRIDSSGNLLVGTTTATGKLTVSGNAYVDGRIASFQTEQAIPDNTWVKAFTVPDDSGWRVWCGYVRTDAAVSSFTYFNVFKAASGAPAVADTPTSATSNGSYSVQLRLNGNDVEFWRSGSFGGGNRQVAVSAIRLW